MPRGDAFPLKQSSLCSAQGFLLNETTKYFNFQFVRENHSLLLTGLFLTPELQQLGKCICKMPKPEGGLRFLGTSFCDGRLHTGVSGGKCSHIPAVRAKGGRMGCREKLSWGTVAEGASVMPEGDGKWTWPFRDPHRGKGARPLCPYRGPSPDAIEKLAVTLTEASPFGQGLFLSRTHWWVPLQKSVNTSGYLSNECFISEGETPRSITVHSSSPSNPIPIHTDFVSCGNACMPSCFIGVQLFVTPWTVAARLLCPWDSAGKRTGVGCHGLFQGLLPPCDSEWSLFLGKC